MLQAAITGLATGRHREHRTTAITTDPGGQNETYVEQDVCGGTCYLGNCPGGNRRAGTRGLRRGRRCKVHHDSEHVKREHIDQHAGEHDHGDR